MKEPASGAGGPERLALRLDLLSELGIVLSAATPVGKEVEGLADELEGLLGRHVGVLVGMEEQCEFLVLSPNDAAVCKGLSTERTIPVRRGEDSERSDGLRHAVEVRAQTLRTLRVFESRFGVVGGFELGLRHGLEAQRFGFWFRVGYWWCHWGVEWKRIKVKREWTLKKVEGEKSGFLGRWTMFRARPIK